MTLRSADTSAAAQRVLDERLRSMTLAEKAELVCQLMDDGLAIAEAGVRLRHPDYDDVQVQDAVHRMWLGDDAVRKLRPDRQLVTP